MSESERQALPTLNPEHEKSLLTGSSITPGLITARGYRTVTVRAELSRLGFTDQQRNVPALLIPLYGVGGDPVGYQTRPDQPRVDFKRGKAVKYETPSGQRMVLDVHPSVRHLITDPTVPLWVTEGVKKGDALASRGCCAIALLGVWNWRGTNEQGGATALPDWERVALRGRQVRITFDSDVMLKEEVHKALARLGLFLKNRGAEVFYIYLPSGEHGVKVGVDDFLAAGHRLDDLLALATTELRRPVTDDASEEATGPYEETESGLVWRRPVGDGSVRTQLTNFTCRIIAEVAEDDGAEVRRRFDLEAWLGGRRIQFSIPAGQFAGMSWVTEHLGARGIVSPGFGLKDHARTAIQTISADVSERRVYTHTGWRQIGEQWVYLHGGGAVGQDGPLPGVVVSLPEALAGYVLPDPPEGEQLKAAVRASLRLLEVAPDRISVPNLAAVWRAALGAADASLHIVGPTGAGKSELAALAQQHYGPKMDARHLPAAWSSTGNALEGLAFQAKDALLAVDDFAPTGGANEVQRIHREADRLLRGQGNNAGRQRMRPDGTLRPARPPRGMILSTGEDVPQGQSLRARLVIVEVGPADLYWDVLGLCQKDAREGHYALAMAGFLRWLAGRYDEVRAQVNAKVAVLRDEATRRGTHRRTPANAAQLGVGLHYFLAFAVDRYILAGGEAQAIWNRCWSALLQTGDTQAQHQEANEPTWRFRKLLLAALASGVAHVANKDGGAPAIPEAWGWRGVAVGAGSFEREDLRPCGARVGWLDGDDLYLEADAAYSVAQRLGQPSGEGIPVTLATLKKRLHEGGLLTSTENRGGKLRFEVRRSLEGRRREVLHVHAASFLSDEVAQVAQVAPDPSSGEGDEAHDEADGTNPPGATPGSHAEGAGPDQGYTGPSGPLGPLPHRAQNANGDGISHGPAINAQPRVTGTGLDTDYEDV